MFLEQGILSQTKVNIIFEERLLSFSKTLIYDYFEVSEMVNVYREFINGFSDGIFKSVRIVMRVIPTSIRKASTTNISYYPTDIKMNSEKEAIRSDFERIGKDLFGALNEYEQKQGLKLTTRCR